MLSGLSGSCLTSGVLTSDLTGDVVDIRSSAVFTGEALDRSSLANALEQLTAQLLSNEQEAFTAQGNLNPSSVLALLED